MLRGALISLALLCATEASALSCLRPDAARSFHNAANASDVYYVYLGRLVLSSPLAEGETTTGTFEGKGLTREGFTQIGERSFQLVSRCAAEWCGSIDETTDALFFARKTDDGLAIDVTPCGNWIFTDPTQATIETVESCMQGGPCEEGPLFR